jgi:hypothetical protein
MALVSIQRIETNRLSLMKAYLSNQSSHAGSALVVSPGRSAPPAVRELANFVHLRFPIHGFHLWPRLGFMA